MLVLGLYVLVAVGISFICSMLEATLLSMTPAYISNLKQTNPKAAARLASLRENIDSPLVGILTLNTIAHTAGAAGAGAQATKVFGSEALGWFSAVLTLAILFLSEILPKTIGARYWRQLGPQASIMLTALVTITKPLIIVSGWITSRFTHGGDEAHIRAEMSAMADIGAESGELDAQESRILKQLLRARSLPVSAIMTPRTVIHSLPESLTLREFAQQHGKKSFSRIPVFCEGPDDIVGYVSRSEVLITEKTDPDATLRSVRHKLLVIPETAKLMTLFELLLTRHAQLAIVADEYGDVRGLVTMEDIIESMLGLEIVDHKDPSKDMQQLARRLWEHRQKERKFRVSEEPDDREERKKEHYVN
ncbi:CNNM domain-containing protein [Ferrimonas senticii]|uniref:CNNM domain-containing protein n=1 Tax=Ferrimonas senticii TaxID=394566 RepID=UPI0003F86E5B|nr:CNNM domain-containing protein [Ferrimonas senticii]